MLDYLVHSAPSDLVVAAFLVVFLTRMPQQRGLTLAKIGCVINLLVSMAGTLLSYRLNHHDALVPSVLNELLRSAWISIPLMVVAWFPWILWIVALHLLCRDNSQHVADTQHTDALRPFGPAS
jgi:predicted membrane protein